MKTIKRLFSQLFPKTETAEAPSQKVEDDSWTFEYVFKEFKRYYSLTDEDVAGLEEDEELMKLLRKFFARPPYRGYQISAIPGFHLLADLLRCDYPPFNKITWNGWPNLAAKIKARHAARWAREEEARRITYSEESVECPPEAMAGATTDIGLSNLPIEP